MFRQYYLDNDPFNSNKNRNISNTPKNTFNCAGYALETFSWYCPHSEEDDKKSLFGLGYDYSFSSEEEALQKTLQAVNYMINDFCGKLRLVASLDEVNQQEERVVAFRISSYDDFHYIKRGMNGRWYHKRGGRKQIEEMSEKEVFCSTWCNYYDGPIMLLAIKR